jgi:hypothetical protein
VSRGLFAARSASTWGEPCLNCPMALLESARAAAELVRSKAERQEMALEASLAKKTAGPSELHAASVALAVLLTGARVPPSS